MEHEEDIRQLMTAAIKGDREAFGSIFTHLYTPIFRYLYMRTGSRAEAEDLTQQVFLNAYRAIPRFRLRPQPPHAFFFRIAKNSLIDFYRKKKAIPLDDILTNTLESPDDSTEQLLVTLDMERVQVAMKKLTDEQAEVINLRFIAELSHEEVAHIIHKKPEAVRALQSRALKALREALA